MPGAAPAAANPFAAMFGAAGATPGATPGAAAGSAPVVDQQGLANMLAALGGGAPAAAAPAPAPAAPLARMYPSSLMHNICCRHRSQPNGRPFRLSVSTFCLSLLHRFFYPALWCST